MNNRCRKMIYGIDHKIRRRMLHPIWWHSNIRKGHNDGSN